MRCPTCGRDRRETRADFIAQGQLLLFGNESLPPVKKGRIASLCDKHGVSPQSIATIIGRPESFVLAMCNDEALVDEDVFVAVDEQLSEALNA